MPDLFIFSSKEIVDGRILGEYSYKDPVGSTVTVTYSVNQDGTDYEESRKILKAYQTSKSSASKSLFLFWLSSKCADFFVSPKS